MAPAIAALSTGLFIAGCSRQETAETVEPPRPVLSFIVEPRTVAMFGPFTGTI